MYSCEDGGCIPAAAHGAPVFRPGWIGGRRRETRRIGDRCSKQESRLLIPFPSETRRNASRRLLSPYLSSTPSRGEGAHRAGEEKSLDGQTILNRNHSALG